MKSPIVWKERSRDIAVENTFIRELSIDPLLARLLVQRGITTLFEAGRYLAPSLDHMHSPFSIPDMQKAAERIVAAIKSSEKIFIHGDYDVDGVTSTALYIRTLQSLGLSPLYRVPNRSEGYDIKPASVVWAKEQGATLIITTDCGIQAHDAVNKANELGIPIIVTDHHEPGEELPDAYAVINPHVPSSQYAFKDIAGVGVAFKVMQAVIHLHMPEAEEEFVDTFLDLVACGTVADVMPLKGENRIFVNFGLHRLRETDKIGLNTLLYNAKNVDMSKPLKADSISFAIAPRINAVGRMDDPMIALNLLLTEDSFEAAALTTKMNMLNDERRSVQEVIFQEALALIDKNCLEEAPFLMIRSESWRHGLVGVVAGKIAETFYKPSIVLHQDGSILKGSGRSIPGYNLFDAVSTVKHLLLKKEDGTPMFGGHAGAIGLSFRLKDFDEIYAALKLHAQENVSGDVSVPSILHDGIVDPMIFQEAQINSWSVLEPFGAANPEPVFASSGFKVIEMKIIGSDKTHLKLSLEKDGETFGCAAWSKASWKKEFKIGQSVDILYTPGINEWNNKKSVQLILRDMR